MEILEIRALLSTFPLGNIILASILFANLKSECFQNPANSGVWQSL